MGLFDFTKKNENIADFEDYIRENYSTFDLKQYIAKYSLYILCDNDTNALSPLFTASYAEWKDFVRWSKQTKTSKVPPKAYKNESIAYIDLMKILSDRGDADAAFVVGALYEYGAYLKFDSDSVDEINDLIDLDNARLYYALARERNSEMYRIYEKVCENFTGTDEYATRQELLVTCLVSLEESDIPEVDNISKYSFYEINKLFSFILTRYAKSGSCYSMAMLAVYLLYIDGRSNYYEECRNLESFWEIPSKERMAEALLLPIYQLADDGVDMAVHIIDKINSI